MSSSEEISAQEINLEQVEQTEQPGDHEKEIVVNLPVANVKLMRLRPLHLRTFSMYDAFCSNSKINIDLL